MRTFFHLAFPTHNLSKAKKFYIQGLGCNLGRESKFSMILKFMDNQLVAHLVPKKSNGQKGIYPRHFGIVFKNLKDWQRFLKRVQTKKLKFYQPPRTRHPGTPVEHQTFFLQDPSDNLLEFKNYKNPQAIFGKRNFKRIGDR
jgi:hypothetical protein